MFDTTKPEFPQQWRPLVASAADALRALALNEGAKERFSNDPLLQPYLDRVAKRYIAGHTVEEALVRVAEINARGHAASAEYMGESCRDEAVAGSETEVFLDLISQIGERGLNCSISLDLSHVGMVIDPELGYRNVLRIAKAALAISREVMISMEGADRADDIYKIYGRLHETGMTNVGITVPAKLHRTVDDLPRLMAHSGRVRLVKGAFIEPEAIGLDRNDPELRRRYLQFSKTLLDSGNLCSIATHDRGIQAELASYIDATGRRNQPYEFESLIGLGVDQIDGLRNRGLPTREYAVFGDQYFLYVLNRIAEEPVRLYQAIIDATGHEWNPVS